MSDDELTCEHRPNAKYKLSKSDNKNPGKEELNYHYSRERRLENAPQNVKDFYTEKKQMRFGLLGTLVADKPRRVLLLVIILMCLGIFALSRFGYFDTTYMLDGNEIGISGTVFEGTTIITVRKNAISQNAYTGSVEIAVSAVFSPSESEQMPVFYHRIFFTMEREEQYRFAVPFDEPELLMVLQNDKSTLQLRIKPD
jgi:hypothetical protein